MSFYTIDTNLLANNYGYILKISSFTYNINTILIRNLIHFFKNIISACLPKKTPRVNKSFNKHLLTLGANL